MAHDATVGPYGHYFRVLMHRMKMKPGRAAKLQKWWLAVGVYEYLRLKDDPAFPDIEAIYAELERLFKEAK